MGFDVFCPLCGCPMNGILVYGYAYPPEPPPKSSRNKDKLTKKEVLYQEIYEEQMQIYQFLKQHLKYTKWMRKVTLLFPNKQAKHHFIEEAGANVFLQKNGNGYYLVEFSAKPYPRNDMENALPMHTDCWKYATKKFKHNLVFEDFLSYKMLKYSFFLLNKLKYTPVKRYWGQYFDVLQLMQNEEDMYILASPLGTDYDAKLNAKRIGQNIQKVIKDSKKYPRILTPTKILKTNRPSPPESATLFKVGTKKRGNDGNVWIVVETSNKVKRWKLK